VRAVAEDGPLAMSRAIAAYMSRQVATCSESDTGGRADGNDDTRPLPSCPVLDEQHRLMGMISIGDVVKTRIAETLNEANSLRDYILPL